MPLPLLGQALENAIANPWELEYVALKQDVAKWKAELAAWEKEEAQDARNEKLLAEVRAKRAEKEKKEAELLLAAQESKDVKDAPVLVELTALPPVESKRGQPQVFPASTDVKDAPSRPVVSQEVKIAMPAEQTASTTATTTTAVATATTASPVQEEAVFIGIFPGYVNGVPPSFASTEAAAATDSPQQPNTGVMYTVSGV